MKPIGILLALLAAMTGCGYKAKVEYAGADHQRVEADNTSHQRTSQQRLQLEVAADLAPEGTASPNDVAPVGPAEQPAKGQPIQSAQAVTIFNGGIHFHGDTVIEPRPLELLKLSEPSQRPDEQCERLRRQHEERVADWLSRFN